MAFPLPSNMTCDIYSGGTAPPSSARVAGVACHLRAAWQAGLEAGEGFPDDVHFTHIMLVGPSTDIRDGTEPYGGAVTLANCDRIYIPDRNGTRFYAIWSERVGRGQANDHKRVYLQRDNGANLTWPNEYL